MKRKDVVYMVLAVGILLVAGYIAYTQLMPKRTASTQGVEVPKIGAIPGEMDSEALAELTSPEKVRDFSSPIDLSGLNNRAIFGP